MSRQLKPAPAKPAFSLKDRLASVLDKRPVAPPEVHRDARTHGHVSAGASSSAGEGSGVYIPPSRRGKRQMQVHLEAETVQHLKRLALDLGVTQQVLVGEALDLLFEKYRKGPVASVSETATAKRGV